MINIIAAIGKNRELGLNNKLIWHLPNDLKYFKEVTLNSTVVMGKKTFDSIGRPLPKRENIVLTHRPLEIENIKVINDLEKLKELLLQKEKVFIIGGFSLYKEFLLLADNLYLTEIDATHEADVYFPEFNKEKYIKEIISEEKEIGIFYKFTIYKRR